MPTNTKFFGHYEVVWHDIILIITIPYQKSKKNQLFQKNNIQLNKLLFLNILNNQINATHTKQNEAKQIPPPDHFLTNQFVMVCNNL